MDEPDLMKMSLCCCCCCCCWQHMLAPFFVLVVTGVPDDRQNDSLSTATSTRQTMELEKMRLATLACRVGPLLTR
jgi:hypothetical protein